eukprot:scaffold3177_cov86-Phaeocystis_antarctica.AAC.14
MAESGGEGALNTVGAMQFSADWQGSSIASPPHDEGDPELWWQRVCAWQSHMSRKPTSMAQLAAGYSVRSCRVSCASLRRWSQLTESTTPADNDAIKPSPLFGPPLPSPSLPTKTPSAETTASTTVTPAHTLRPRPVATSCTMTDA